MVVAGIAVLGREAGEEASLPKPEQQEVCGEIMALMGIARRI